MPFPSPPNQTQEQADADAEILSEISVLCNAATYPALTTDQLAYLLTQSRRADGLGTSVSDPAWIPTYNLNYAVYKGWQIKASNAASAADYADTDQKVSRSQVYRQCSDMAMQWRKKLTATVRVIAPQRSSGQLVPIAPIAPQILPTEQQQENA